MTTAIGRKTVQDWFDEYGVSHRNPLNKLVHFVCVPLIMLSLIGLLWSIPVPTTLRSLPVPLNWATLFLVLALGYYSVLSLPLMAGMIPVATALAATAYQLDRLEAMSLWQTSLGIFALAWVGQFVGHKIEGAKPSFFKDLQFLLIGPLWILGFVYRKLGIEY